VSPATAIFESALGMQQQRYLIAYPVSVLGICNVMF
jgi:hypothetical protein